MRIKCARTWLADGSHVGLASQPAAYQVGTAYQVANDLFGHASREKFNGHRDLGCVRSMRTIFSIFYTRERKIRRKSSKYVANSLRVHRKRSLGKDASLASQVGDCTLNALHCPHPDAPVCAFLSPNYPASVLLCAGIGASQALELVNTATQPVFRGNIARFPSRSQV